MSRGYGKWTAVRYIVATPGWKVGVNRIMGHPIGVYAVLGRHCYSVCKPISGAERRRRQERRLARSGRHE